ncbi:oxidoreductase [Microlunatus panaciterrae]|uniref:NAD(P)-dependent dehydrogenase (Short-subunit alcohol dehydrogenase family) n=1 Tax=Microlunatus panaciterrae TaxID=400768 RepID=A0ABS2RLQ4_9ACTN|nr:oxidoreductase [Microlunatus panaciterrae]MBM7799935.1 NAD(P)-dependent dehydrogenase (short-subunit alcohol dehydrogenase family) [Microlunatus panaciterrae]
MTNRTAIVTGASSGIGEATARRLQADGFTVYAGARRVERMQGLAELGVRVLALDVTDDDSMVAAVEQILAETGRIDVLVNNAGYGSYGAAEDVPMTEARYQLEVNLFGLARLTQLVLPAMREARSGRIINISSIGGRFGESLGAWYHASKFAVEGYSDSIRLELADFGIHVVVVQPGAIRTEWDGIALDSAMTHSGDTAYAAHVETMRATYDSAFGGLGADPSVIAEAIHRAATARRPKIRYVAPQSAKAMMVLARLLPDRLKDTLFRRMLMGGGIDVDSAVGV